MRFGLFIPQGWRLDADGPLVGTPGQVIDKLRALSDVGMTYAIVYFDDIAYDRAAAELFVREVIPALAD